MWIWVKESSDDGFIYGTVTSPIRPHRSSFCFIHCVLLKSQGFAFRSKYFIHRWIFIVLGLPMDNWGFDPQTYICTCTCLDQSGGLWNVCKVTQPSWCTCVCVCYLTGRFILSRFLHRLGGIVLLDKICKYILYWVHIMKIFLMKKSKAFKCVYKLYIDGRK